MRNWLEKILAIDAPRKWIVLGAILYASRNWWLDFPMTIVEGKFINPDLDFFAHYIQNELAYFLFIYLICKPRVNDVVARGLLIYTGGEVVSVLIAQLYFKGVSFNDYTWAALSVIITLSIEVKNKPEKYKRIHSAITYLKRIFSNDKNKGTP